MNRSVLRLPGFRISTALILLMAAALGCDSVPSVDSGDGQPANISAFSFSPAVIDLSTIPLDRQTESTVSVAFSVEARVVVGDATVQSVQYIVQGLEIGDDPIAVGELLQSGAMYRAEFDLTLDKGAVGNYSLLLFAVDSAGRISNRARGTVSFISTTGSPPVVVDVQAEPDTVASGATFRLIAEVTDPDGLSNVLRVDATGPNQTPFAMEDDGGEGGSLSGDDVAGDGLYTVTFQVPAGTPAGTVTFEIQAFDRSGLSSEVVQTEVTIE